jgi:hypothetical protein
LVPVLMIWVSNSRSSQFGEKRNRMSKLKGEGQHCYSTVDEK